MNPNLLCGVDLGGTKILVAIIDSTGQILKKKEIRDHRGRPENHIVNQIAETVFELLDAAGAAPSDIPGIGVGTSGHVNHRTGTVITNSNLPGFTNYPLAERLQERTNLSVRVDNDANAQAWAEYSFGASRGFDNNAFVTVSTGIGAGFVIDGRLYRGITGTSGEIGHTIIKPDSTIRCGCGNKGCLMAHASGLALPQVIRERAASFDGGTPDLDGMDDAEINGEFVKAGLDSGEAFRTSIVDEYAYYMGIGLQNLFQVMNPGIIILGGGLTSWGDYYLQQVRKTFYRIAGTMMYDRIEIRSPELKTESAVIGAAALLLEGK